MQTTLINVVVVFVIVLQALYYDLIVLFFRCNSDYFEFDDRPEAVMNMKNFYVRYKDKVPMLAIFIGGWDGMTPYDCYENLQVNPFQCEKVFYSSLNDDFIKI